jgi:hypothetical protein
MQAEAEHFSANRLDRLFPEPVARFVWKHLLKLKAVRDERRRLPDFLKKAV